MKGEYNALISTSLDRGNYPKSRDSCFDVGISGNCIGNCLLCIAFEDDYDKDVSKLNKGKENLEENLQELIDMGLIDLEALKVEYLEIKEEV